MALNSFIRVSKAIDANDIAGILLGIETLPDQIDNRKYQDTFLSILYRFLTITVNENYAEAQLALRCILEKLTLENARTECFKILSSMCSSSAKVSAEFMIDHDMKLTLKEANNLVEVIKKQPVDQSHLLDRIAITSQLMRLSCLPESVYRQFFFGSFNVVFPQVRKASIEKRKRLILSKTILVEMLSIAPGHPFLQLNNYQQNYASFFPYVYSKSYKCEMIMNELTIYVQSNVYIDSEAQSLIPLISIVCDSLKFFNIQQNHITTVSNFWNSAFQIFHDSPEIDEKNMIRLFKDTLNNFSNSHRPIFLKRLLKLFSNKKSSLNMYEPCTVALVIDTYRQSIKLPEYQNELGELWTIIYSLRYDNIYNSSSFYSSIFMLAYAQALNKINKDLCKEVLIKVIEPLYEQIVDFKKMMELDNKKSEFGFPEQIGSDFFSALVFHYHEAHNSIEEFLNN